MYRHSRGDRIDQMGPVRVGRSDCSCRPVSPSVVEGSLVLICDRVPNADHQWISWCLDAGASGIILPHASFTLSNKIVVSGKLTFADRDCRTGSSYGRFRQVPQRRSHPSL